MHFFENRRSFDFRLDLFLQLEKKKILFFFKKLWFFRKNEKNKKIRRKFALRESFSLLARKKSKL